MSAKTCPDMVSGKSNIVNFCKNASKNTDFTQFEIVRGIYDSNIFAQTSLSGSAKLVLIALAHHFNPKKEDMFPSQKFLANKLGISERSAERAVAELKDADLISYETRRVNRYKFTAKFFNAVKMSGNFRQNVGEEDRQNVGQTNKHEQKNNNSFKNDFSSCFAQPKGIEYPKATPIVHEWDDRTPENDLETAQNFVKKLWDMRENHVVKARLKRVLTIWGDKICTEGTFLPDLEGEKPCQEVVLSSARDTRQNVGDASLSYSNQF